MLFPSIDHMVNKVGSKYSLVIAASKRARNLRDGTKSHLKNQISHKYVGIALEELYNDDVLIERVSKDDVK